MSLRRRSPHGSGLAVLLIGMLLAGCSGQTRSEPRTPPRTTIPGRTRPSQQALQAALLTVDEVRALRNAPPALAEEPSPAAAGEHPDPRGPCGARLAPPSTAGAATRRFADPAGIVVDQLVFGLPPGRADRYLAAVRADMRPHCPAFRARTPDGVQTTQFLGAVPLPPVGDDRLAEVVRTGGEGAVAYWMTARVRSGTSLTVVLVGADAQVPQQFLIDLAVAAARKLP